MNIDIKKKEAEQCTIPSVSKRFFIVEDIDDRRMKIISKSFESKEKALECMNIWIKYNIYINNNLKIVNVC